MKKSEATAEDCAKAAACELFEGCGQEEISAFLKESGVTVLTFSGRERIPREERRTRWGIVLSGSVRLYAGDESGGEMLLNVVGAGQPFDIASLACGSGNPVRSEAQAAGKCRVAFLGVPEPANFTANYPRIAANVMRFFCGRIGFLTRMRGACHASESVARVPLPRLRAVGAVGHDHPQRQNHRADRRVSPPERVKSAKGFLRRRLRKPPALITINIL